MPREYSQKPAAAKRRIRKANKGIERDIEFIYGKPVEEWDFEELQRGRPRGPNGTFSTGLRPKYLTPQVLTEARKRLKILTRDELSHYAGAAIDVLKDLMSDDREDHNGKPITPSTVKYQAATYILDQIIGRPTQAVEIEGNVKLEGLLAAIVVNPDGSEAHPVVEGYVEEITDDDSD